MRRAISITLDDEFIRRMDKLRERTSRGRWVESEVDAPVLVPERSPEPEGEPEIPQLDKWGNPVGTEYEETDPRSWT